MRIIVLSLILFCCGTCPITAQSNYIVTTPSTQKIPVGEEEQFIKNNFPLQPLCKWTPGMKFMFVPSTRNMFLPTLSSYDTDKGIDNSLLKHKILTFTGTEEKAQNISTGTNYSTRFVFECEGGKYYYDIKNMRLDEICEKAPRADINGLVYLKDVDTAKELLVGKTVYIQSESARVDDANNYSGYRDIAIPVNTEATITAIGVGSQAYPVKIVFKDTQGHSYYLEVALSRTNSGMDLNDFQGEKRMKYFSNAFSFTNKSLGTIESLKNKYLGMTVYPKKMLPAKRIVSFEDKQTESRVHLPRYTVLQIKEIKLSPPGSLATLSLTDRDGASYELETDLKYDVIVKNDNYIEDFFGFEDIHKKYPGITESRWQIISRGDLEAGMSTVECRLSIGDPIEIELKKDSRFETWFYNGKTLEFENGTLQRYK
mgnify:FL=1